MCRLSSLGLFFLISSSLIGQSPHGDNLEVSCDLCHDASGWTINRETIQFDHNTTNFMLEGAHNQTDCNNCHKSLVFNEVSDQCIDCHTDVHSSSVGDDCARCHTSESWLVNNFAEIHEENGFALFGVHSTLSCEECHLSETRLRFDKIGNECINCHREDYMSTQSPNHPDAGFSTNCIECHDILGTGWGSENFLHDFFPLTLGHDISDCKECHVSGSFSDLSPECVSCHQSNYNETTNPNHQALNFSTSCTSCHTIDPNWRPARFDAHNEYYPLNGAHALVAGNCALCHTADYSNTPNTCVGCHINDYNNTQNPSHSQAHFSTDCKECHNENAWKPASFDHDAEFFPIYSGKHRGEWNNCTDCHTNTADYSIFTCITCHKQSSTNSEHDEVSGYQYVSSKCLQCHPDGSD